MNSRRDFPRDVGVLGQIFDFLGDFAAASKLKESVRFSLDFAVEELFTNMVKYGGGKSGDISIGVSSDDSCVRLELVDPDADPFDPSSLPDVDITQSISERRPGRLGIHLVEAMVDHVSYEYEGREMKITVVKQLES